MRIRLGALLAALALAGIAVLASGCGASLDPVAQAATRTSSVSTLRFSMDLGLQLPTSPAAVHLTASGAVDGAGKRLSLTMDFSRLAAISGDDRSVPGRMTLLLDGPSMYLSAPALTRALPPGKTWARVDLDRAASALGTDVTALTSGQTDPRTSLAQLRKAGNVVRIGPQRVDGVPAVRYSVLLDTRAGLDRLHGALRREAEAALDRLEASGHRYVPADAWVDGDGYLRRFRVTMPDYLGPGSSFTMSMDLFGFGSDVRIATPPAEAVEDVTDRLPSLG